MTYPSSDGPPKWDDRPRAAMVRDGAYVARRISLWRNCACPFCGNEPTPRWICLLSTYTLHCQVCGEVIETFELHRDTTGHLFTENHQIALGRVPEAKGTSWRRIHG
jgi:hypothetical protein